MNGQKTRAKIGAGKERFFIIAMLIIPISNFLMFWAYTNIDTLLMAFQKWDSAKGKDVWTMNNFKLLFEEMRKTDSSIWINLKNTALYFCTDLFLMLPLCLLLCYFLYKRIAGYKVFRFVFNLPAIVIATVYSVIFKQILAPGGAIGALSLRLTGETIPFLTDSRYATATIWAYYVYINLAGNLIYFTGAMSNIDSEIIEAGKIDGTMMTTELVRLVIPLIWPTLSTMILFKFVGIFGASGPVMLFTQGAYKTSTFSFWLYELVYYSQNYYYSSALGILLTLATAPIVFGLRKLLLKGYVGE